MVADLAFIGGRSDLIFIGIILLMLLATCRAVVRLYTKHSASTRYLNGFIYHLSPSNTSCLLLSSLPHPLSPGETDDRIRGSISVHLPFGRPFAAALPQRAHSLHHGVDVGAVRAAGGRRPPHHCLLFPRHAASLRHGPHLRLSLSHQIHVRRRRCQGRGREIYQKVSGMDCGLKTV